MKQQSKQRSDTMRRQPASGQKTPHEARNFKLRQDTTRPQGIPIKLLTARSEGANRNQRVHKCLPRCFRRKTQHDISFHTQKKLRVFSLSECGQSALRSFSVVVHERLAVQGVPAEPLFSGNKNIAANKKKYANDDSETPAHAYYVRSVRAYAPQSMRVDAARLVSMTYRWIIRVQK